MKRLSLFLLCAALAVSMCACGAQQKQETPTPSAAPSAAPAPAPETPASTGGALTEEDAKRLALADAGVAAEADVSRLSVKREEKKSGTAYEVGFRFGDWAYEYELDAATGEITEVSADFRGELPSETGDVGEDAAADAALAHAGLHRAQAEGLRIEQDKESGRQVYEADFRCGDWKYDYDVDAATGAILEWERSLKKK